MDRPGRTCRLIVVVALLALVGVAPATALPATADAPRAAEAPAAGQLDVAADRTTIRIALRADGAAAWDVQYAMDLTTENESDAFADLRADVAANRSAYVDPFAAGIRATAADAENATGREMSVSNVTVTTSRSTIQQTGYVTYQFEWDGFAVVEGDRIVADDALAGFFLDGGTTLVVSWPDAYDLRSVDPDATRSGNSVSWAGESVTFDADGPRVVVARGGGGVPTWLLGVAAAGVLVAVAGGTTYLRRRGAAPDEATAEGDRSQDGRADAADTEDPPAAGPPDELLSNEERVLELLDRRGGRVKQQEIVSALDWTAAKTSQVVSDMAEAGEVEKFRLGRENVVTLPEESLNGGEES